MSETKFTKGPWKAVPDTTTRLPDKVYMVVGPSEIYIHDDGICRFDHYNGRSFEEDKANMQLISAAPEMYEGIETAIDELKAWQKCAYEAGLNVTSTPYVIDHLESILAKARGE